MPGEGGRRRRIDAGELRQPPDQPRQGRPARAEGDVGAFHDDLAQLPVERRRNVQIGEAIVPGEVSEPGDGSGAEVLDVGRQAPPGVGVERCAANLCEIAELPEESGEVRRRHPDPIRARVMSPGPSDWSQGAIRYCPHGAGTRSTGRVFGECVCSFPKSIRLVEWRPHGASGRWPVESARARIGSSRRLHEAVRAAAERRGSSHAVGG